MPAPDTPQSVLVVMPTWLGDVVMATPMLRALRGLWPEAAFTVALREPMRALTASLPLDAASACWDASASSVGRHDLAVVTPNSFRSAWWARSTGSPRRLGYARDGRGWLLTDRLVPLKDGRRFLPVPTAQYYLGLAAYLGADITDSSLSLHVPDGAQEEADQVLQRAGIQGPFVLLNPGAVRESKRWPAERFAELAERINHATGIAVAVTGSPAERPVLDAVSQASRTTIADLAAAGLKLGELPAVVQRASLLVTNDTGPRHVAAAVGTPVVTLFGPTPPQWTVIDFEHEHQIVAGDESTALRASAKREVEGHTMDLITVDTVQAAVQDLLAAGVNP